MDFLKRLFRPHEPSGTKSDREMHRLAALLATEVKLYNPEELNAVSGLPPLPDRLAREMARAYRTYTKHVGASDEAEAIFCLKFAQTFAGGDEELVKSVLHDRAGDARPIEPS